MKVDFLTVQQNQVSTFGMWTIVLSSLVPSWIVTFVENGYPDDVLLSCINKKFANFAAEKSIGQEKCPVYQNCLGLLMLHRSLQIKSVKPLQLVTML